MKKHYVINKGEIWDAKPYLSQARGNFARFIERESFPDEYPLPQGSQSDYSRYANKLGFEWEPNADLGVVQYDYRAKLIMRLIEEYARNLVNSIGFPVYEISGSNMFDEPHPVVQAYANLYGERLYRIPSGQKSMVMSYDASYPQFNLAKKYQLSEKHLPFGHFSVSDCYRHEQSGECMLLYRQRRFYMPDIHPYFKNIDEAFDWVPRMEEKIIQAIDDANYEYEMVIEVSSPENWQVYKDKIIQIAANFGKEVLVNVLDDGKDRYWVVNVDYKIIDQLGQSREIACIQVDIGNAPRLGIEYKDSAGKMVNPVIIHSAIPGGVERYLYMLLDDFKNRFPLWLNPAHIRLIPVSEKHLELAKSYLEKYKDSKVRIEIDDRDISVGKRVKLSHEDLIPFSVVIGENEENRCPELEGYVKRVIEGHSGDKPFLSMNYPKQISQRIVL